MMTAALLSSVILFSNSVYAITSQDSTTYNENYEKKEDDLSTQFLMTALPNVDDVKSPFKDYETNKYEKDQINYADDYYNYKDNKYHYSDDYYYKNQDNADDIITTPISIC